MRTIITVPDNYVSENPIHFCFILDTKWTKQAVQPTWHIWKNAKVKIFAYCFGVEYDVTHGDWKKYYLEENAELEVYEFNYNAVDSYMTVYNTFEAELWTNAFFRNYYVSTVWHLWHGITKWNIYCKWDNSKAEFITKNKILEKDISDLDIKIYLQWQQSSWIINSKTVTYSWWTNFFKGELIWEWDNTKWHMECDEISMWKCSINTSPSLKVQNPTSRLTHEASVWTLEKKSIENLMIKWFTQEQAINFLVNGILDIK
jgi:Fe-S cluster assembly scaffold protein SufB